VLTPLAQRSFCLCGHVMECGIHSTHRNVCATRFHHETGMADAHLERRIQRADDQVCCLQRIARRPRDYSDSPSG
jgi:hypothetical protein